MQGLWLREMGRKMLTGESGRGLMLRCLFGLGCGARGAGRLRGGGGLRRVFFVLVVFVLELVCWVFLVLVLILIPVFLLLLLWLLVPC